MQQVLGRQVWVSLSSPVLHCCQGRQISELGLKLQALTSQSLTHSDQHEMEATCATPLSSRLSSTADRAAMLDI